MSPNVRPDIIVTPSAFSAPTLTYYATAVQANVGASGYSMIMPHIPAVWEIDENV
jgi:hypothetical protein